MTVTLVFSVEWLWVTLGLTYFYFCGYCAGWFMDPASLAHRIAEVWYLTSVVERRIADAIGAPPSTSTGAP